jgi:RNA polymerase sigma-70 factor (sigma-E family)
VRHSRVSTADRRRAEFERFVAESTQPLLRTAFLVAGDVAEAEDLVQECLIKVARRWPKVRTMQHPRAYARRVLVNLALDDSRRRVRRRAELELPAGRHDGLDEGSARDLAAVDSRSELESALDTLAPRQRAVLVLRYFEDLSEADTAAALGCSVGTVKSTASRALARLQSTLAPITEEAR